MNNIYDIAVIGGGHAGLEAAWISSQFNLKVLLITSPHSSIASAPCNPAVGGVGKGQVVKEIDALGGLMGVLADEAGLQYRVLNESKGYAVQSTRVQIDKDFYSQRAEHYVHANPNIFVKRDIVTNVSKDDDQIFTIGASESTFQSRSVILTTGTFLNGKLHTGELQTEGGRVDCQKSVSLFELLKNAQLFGGRFKTGTPARLNKESINYSVMEEQESDSRCRNFSLQKSPFHRNINQKSCYLTRTNENTLNIIRNNKERSPIFNGQISGVGPRYCPSIEDKAFRYPEKHSHHVFVEPEGLNLNTVYPNGVSTSLPKEVQLEFLQTINGLENCQIEVYGYAVEYDVVDTTKLDLSLMAKEIPGLYFAGQVCGTSGYEEAAGQGIVAGINAAFRVLNKGTFRIDRKDSYIGVLIEDLVSNKRDEPYRLFTARSENRLQIREDNTFLRMYAYRKQLDLNLHIDVLLARLMSEFNLLMTFIESIYSLKETLKRPELDPVEELQKALLEFELSFNYDVVKAAAVSTKYSGYISRAEQELEKFNKLEKKKINCDEILASTNISFECKLRIERIKPETFGQLQRIEGIRPATLAYVAGNIL